MSTEENKRDYKGWISIVIGVCAVWISYETFMWQKSQTENDQPDAADPGQQSTSGSDNGSSGSDTYQHESTHADPVNVPADNSKQDKGNKKNNKKNK